MIRILAFSLFMLATQTLAADITITLSDDEQRAIIQLLDTANKAGGLSNAEAVVYFIKKIQAAQQGQPSGDPRPKKE